MIENVVIKNFVPLDSIRWSNLGSINLVIGNNGCGKTILLKALYSAMRTVEGFQRGDDKRSVAEILHEKLYWTFQPDKVGDLVKKGKDSLWCEIDFNGRKFLYRFGKDTTNR